MIHTLPFATLLALAVLSKANNECTLIASGGDDSPQIKEAFNVRDLPVGWFGAVY